MLVDQTDAWRSLHDPEGHGRPREPRARDGASGGPRHVPEVHADGGVRRLACHVTVDFAASRGRPRFDFDGRQADVPPSVNAPLLCAELQARVLEMAKTHRVRRRRTEISLTPRSSLASPSCKSPHTELAASLYRRLCTLRVYNSFSLWTTCGRDGVVPSGRKRRSTVGQALSRMCSTLRPSAVELGMKMRTARRRLALSARVEQTDAR